MNDADIPMILGNFPVHHVHGKLPPLPTGHPSPNPLDEFTRPWLDWIVQATDAVRIVLDGLDEPTLDLARKAVAAAEVLCFLGFAYADENLNGRLQLPGSLAGRSVNVFGSAKGETEGSRARVLEIFRHGYANMYAFTLGTTAQGCAEFLRAHYILRG
jgi:hypothetical protein